MHYQKFVTLFAGLVSMVTGRHICNTLCDNAPADRLTNIETVEFTQVFGRRIALVASTGDFAVYGRIYGGPGCEVWLDRSWDDGKTWDGVIGRSKIPAGADVVSTPVFNIRDPKNDGSTGRVRACGKVEDRDNVVCTHWYPRLPPATEKYEDAGQGVLVCNKVCDRSKPNSLTSAKIVASTELFFRQIELLASSKEAAAHARISRGFPGDEVWIERSWDNGSPENNRLGYRKILDAETFVSSPVYNYNNLLSLGKIRACGKAGDRDDIACTDWTRAKEYKPPIPTICNKVCDKSSAQDLSDVEVFESTEVFGRKIELLATTADFAAYGRMHGGPGCEVWLDRSWDDGKTWEARIGSSKIPAGAGVVSTPVFNIWDPQSDDSESGRIRACGKVENRDNVVCTHWHPRLAPVTEKYDDSGEPTQVCQKVCDRSSVRSLTVPEIVGSSELFWRKIELISSPKEAAAHARISRAFPTDEVWLERSWDDGSPGGDRLGYRRVPDAETSVNSPVYNYNSKSTTGKIRACGKAGDRPDIVCTSWTQQKEPIEEESEETEEENEVPFICNKVCDNTPASGLLDAETVEDTEIFGRKIELKVADNGAYGRINGGPGCEVWLDRSWNDGKTSEARIGSSTVPDGAEFIETPVFNIRNSKSERFQTGRIRACGKVGDRDNVVCTHWYPRLPPTTEKYEEEPGVTRICGKVCDKSQHLSLTSPETVAKVEIFGRKIEVIASHAETAAYAIISGGFAGDEVWIVRAWDDASPTDERLGYKRIPDAETSVHTPVYNYNNSSRLGKIQACGKAGDRDDIACTDWTRAKEAESVEAIPLIEKGIEGETAVNYQTTEEPPSVDFVDCAISIIEYMRDSGDSLYNKFTRISEEEAINKFRRSFCHNYGRSGNCNECFKEVFQLVF